MFKFLQNLPQILSSVKNVVEIVNIVSTGVIDTIEKITNKDINKDGKVG